MKILNGNALFTKRNVEKQMVPPFDTSALFENIENEFAVDEPFNWRVKANIEQKEPKIHASIGILKPLSRVLLLMNHATETNELKGFGGFAKLKDGSVICEYWDDMASSYEGIQKDYSDSPRIIVRLGNQNEVSAVVINQAKEKSVYQLNNDLSNQSNHSHSSCALIYAEICRAMLQNETEIQKMIYDTITELKDIDIASSLTKMEAINMIKLAYNIYALMKYSNEISNLNSIKDNTFFDDINSETIELLNVEDIKEQVNCSSTIGDLSFMHACSLMEEENATYHYVKDSFGIYALDENRVLSEKEKNMIPNIDSNWIIPEEVMNIAHIIQQTSSMKTPIRNLIFSGPAGTGKTESTKMLALTLGIPYVNFSCSPDTERLDLTMSIIPNANMNEEEKLKLSFGDLEVEDWGFDPCGSYQKITGKKKQDATANDCLQAVLAHKESIQSDGFRYVYSNIIKAFKYGWLCEIQEPTVISKAGVLTSLNAMLDGCQSITLMNGETIQRHKDCVICFTTNLDYEGCNPINQSVLSRCVPIELHGLSEHEAMMRVMNASGYTEKEIVKKMVMVYFKCIEYARNGYITDGAIDLRALIQWAEMNAVNGELYANGLMCLINKCTMDKELQIEFEGCLKDHFLVDEKNN